MSRVTMLLAATVLSGAVLAGRVALAQMPDHAPRHQAAGFNAADFDPAQLPEFKGKVVQYTLAPGGRVTGLILADGTEVRMRPWLSTALVFSIKPGDEISIRGLKARNAQVVAAVTLTNLASGAVVSGAVGDHQHGEGPRMDVTGKVKMALHSLHGDVDGVLLEDGTSVRLPPHAAHMLGDLLKPGNTVVVRGFGTTSPLGTAVGAVEIGPSADKLTRLDMPHHPQWGQHENAPDGHPGGAMMQHMHDMMHGGPAPSPAPAEAAPAPR